MSRYKNVWVNGKLMQEHRLVWESAHGPIPPGYEIHHIDGNGHNNDLSNLQLLTRSEHSSLHAKMRKLGVDVVDTVDPDVVAHRLVTRQYCEKHSEDRRRKGAEYRSTHKEQERARKKKYYAENREARLAYDRNYRKEHAAELREYGREHGKRYYAEHKEERRVYVREYNKTHAAENAARNAAYYAEHKEERLAYLAHYREINGPLLRAKERLKQATRRGDSPEKLAALNLEVESAKKQVAENKAKAAGRVQTPQ